MSFVAPVTLQDRGLRLVPLALEHEAGLRAAAADGELWQLRITSVPEPEQTRDYIVAALAQRGYKRILIEGGAATVSAFLAAGALHRLHLSIAPMVIGSGPIGVNLPPIDELEAALRPVTVTHHLGEDVLFDCQFKAD